MFAWARSLGAVLVLLLVACGDSSPVEPAPPCSFTVSPSSLSFAESGGSSPVTVATASHCSWTATADQPWIGIAGSSGTGNGTATITVPENVSTDPRSGGLTIAGHPVRIDQSGRVPCTIDLSPAEASHGDGPATGTFEVRTLDDCRWTAASRDGWIEITSGGAGSGRATIAYTIAGNSDASQRTGRIEVNDRTFTILQAGRAPTCDYAVGPVTLDACMSVPFELTTTITTGAGCTWTATADASWITIMRGNSGSGSGVVGFRLADNWDAPRTGTVMLRWPAITAGQNVRVSQGGCRYATSVTEISIGSGAGTAAFDVLQQSDPISCGGPLQDRCLWTAQADVSWITITTPMSRTGDDRVTFVVAANSGAAPRSGSIQVRDRVVRVTQAAGSD